MSVHLVPLNFPMCIEHLLLPHLVSEAIKQTHAPSFLRIPSSLRPPRTPQGPSLLQVEVRKRKQNSSDFFWRIFVPGLTYSSVYAGQTAPGSSEENNSLASHSSCDKNFQVILRSFNSFKLNQIKELFTGTSIWAFKNWFWEIHPTISRSAFDCNNSSLNRPGNSVAKQTEKLNKEQHGTSNRIKSGHCRTTHRIFELPRKVCLRKFRVDHNGTLFKRKV